MLNEVASQLQILLIVLFVKKAEDFWCRILHQPENKEL